MKSFLFASAFVLSLIPGALHAESAERSAWDFTVGFTGTEAVNTGSSADTLYWGPFLRAAYEFSDPLRARFGVRHTQNKFLYDGLGGIARQANTGISPAVNWEITESISVDAEYTYRFGENEYRENAGVLAIEYAGFNILRLSIDGYLSQQSYKFPVTDTRVNVRGYGASFEVAYLPTKQIEVPVMFSYVNSRYNTNGTSYNVRTFSPGITFRTRDKIWSFTGAGVIGSDSSKYTIYGLEVRIRFKATEKILLRLSGALNHYSYSAPKNPRGSKAVTSAESISPIGNSEAFDLASAGLEVAYTF